MAEIGIVIVTYFSEAEIGPCLDAALPSGADIVVVDNGSTDGTVAEAARRGIRVIANGVNRGFAAAVNQGISLLKTPFVLLLNPDAVIQGGIESLRAACDRPGAAGAGGLLLGNDGRPQVEFMVRALPTPAALILEACLLNRLWPGNPVNRRYRARALDTSRPARVEQPAGAFLMIRRDAWRELRGFDESFFPLWFEDADFCRRAVDRGYNLYYEPGAVAKHTGAHSIAKMGVEARRVCWYSGMIRYAAKHFRPVWFRATCLGVLAGVALRALAEAVAARSLKGAAGFGAVARLAGGCLVFGWKGHAVTGPGARLGSGG
ncbi:MAG: glycosyltransferase family 2 protein [Bryobacteraceae bacterium]|jgi:GT2 family glycosyltransferase